ncbi:MAG: thermosome subunit alpha [Candidatus Syntropharchaeia archaeon]
MSEKHIKLDSLLTLTRKAFDERMVGDEARESCITAAKVLCNSVRSALGPKGLYKMLSEEHRPLVITKDGFSIITGLIVEHPAARLIAELAKAQDEEVGDGTTSTVILAGELLSKAENLLDLGLHPVMVVEGYWEAVRKSLEILEELKVPIREEKTYIDIAKSALKEFQNEKLNSQVVEAVNILRSGEKFDLNLISLRTVEGRGFEDSRLIRGSILFNWVIPGSPKRMEDARIAIIRDSIQIKRDKSILDMTIDASQIKSLLEKEEEMLRRVVGRVKEVGANVVICKGDIDLRAQGMFSSEGIFTVEKVLKPEDLDHLSLATGAKIVPRLEDLCAEDLGRAEVVEEGKIAEEEIIFFEGCADPRACTFFIRGGTKEVVKEHRKVVYDAIYAVGNAYEEPFVVPGGGAVEIEISRRLRSFAHSMHTKKQLAALAFADALEVIPATLAYNSGLDPIDVISELRSKETGTGICIGEEIEIGNTFSAGIIDPLRIKKHIILGALEATEMILLSDGILRDRKRIDKLEEEEEKRRLGEDEEEEEEEFEGREVFEEDDSR